MIILKKLYRLFFPLPAVCPVCMQPTKSLKVCPSCREKILQKRKLYGQCKRCGSFGVDSYGCKTCENWGTVLNGNIAVWPHEGEWQQLILDYKFRHKPWLAEAIAEQMIPFLEETYDFVVPVPLHPNRRHERGYSQSELLAREIARKTEIPFNDCLTRVRDTPHQIGGNREMRSHNLKGAFVVKCAECVDGKTVLLVDDVLTTGATLYHCSLALKQAGAKKVMGITVAAGKTKEIDEKT